MGKAQFLVSAKVMAYSLMTPIDMPWPDGTHIIEEDESEWHSKSRLRVVIEYPDIPESELEPLWCTPSFYKNESGEPEFERWNFHEDWE